MLIQLFTIATCIGIVSSEHPCKKWSSHRNFNLIHSGGVCGQETINKEIKPRILKGDPAIEGSLPWMARISSDDGKHTRYCGGSVINDNFILTAAHCIHNGNPTIKVILGLHNRGAMDDGHAEEYEVIKHTIHPKYDQVSAENDIALLRLGRSINFESPYINYICLPTTCDVARRAFHGVNFTMAGWGRFSNVYEADTLQKVELPEGKCIDYKRNGRNHVPFPSQLCTWSVDAMTCPGDSGGPLLYKTADRVVQVGVMSFGPSDCSPSSLIKVGYFSRVASFMSWILNNIEP